MFKTGTATLGNLARLPNVLAEDLLDFFLLSPQILHCFHLKEKHNKSTLHNAIYKRGVTIRKTNMSKAFSKKKSNCINFDTRISILPSRKI